jgi:hypothetical protein
MKPVRTLGLLAVMGTLVVHAVRGQVNRIPEAEAAASPGWAFTFTPFFWGAGLDGRVGLGSNVSDVSIGIGDVIDQFDIGVMGLIEARRLPFVLRTDLFWVSLGDEQPDHTVNQEQLILQPEAGYSIVTRPWGGIDALVGARYWHVSVDVINPSQTISGVRKWIDATVGAALRYQPASRWHLFAKADVGGGGSQFSWLGVGGAGYDVGSCCTVDAAYRYLDVDYDHDAFVYDVHLDGPAVGLTIHF